MNTAAHKKRRGASLSIVYIVASSVRFVNEGFALLSNEKMDALTALELYRNKDIVEKAFGNLKERLNLRRTLVSSEQNLKGKLFIEFVALIYLSYLNKQMQISHLYKD